jgi:hypothetical protein
MRVVITERIKYTRKPLYDSRPRTPAVTPNRDAVILWRFEMTYIRIQMLEIIGGTVPRKNTYSSIVHHRLLDDGVNLELALGCHRDGYVGASFARC